MTMKIIYCLVVIAVILAVPSCVKTSDPSTPPAHLRPRGTTNWTSLDTWERKSYPALKISMEVPKERQYEEVKFTPPEWKGPPLGAGRVLMFSLHTASRGFLMEPASKTNVFIEHYTAAEWQEALSGKRGSLIELNYDDLKFQPRLTKKIDPGYFRVFYRRDYKLPDGSVVIAGTEVRLSHNWTKKEANEDEAEIRRILNSVKPL